MSAAAEGASPGDALREALGAGDVERARLAVSAWAAAVRAAVDVAELERFAEALRALGSHASGRLRQTVAEASDVLPEEAFEALARALEGDPDRYVQAALRHAAKRRASRGRARAKEGDVEKVVASLLSEMKRDHGERAHRLAERIVRRGTEYFVRKLHHEEVKAMTSLEYALVRARSEAARAAPDRASLAEHLDAAWEHKAHFQRILDRALAATGTSPPRFCDEGLLPLLEEARAQLAMRLGAGAARLSVTIDADPALRLDVDRSALSEVLQNVLQNAVEATPDGAPIAIAICARRARLDADVEIAIADRGVGMTAEQRARLFVPFASRKPGGTGLGMLIVRTMVEELHGGALRLKSEPGAGTTVTLVLPAKQAGRRVARG